MKNCLQTVKCKVVSANCQPKHFVPIFKMIDQRIFGAAFITYMLLTCTYY